MEQQFHLCSKGEGAINTNEIANNWGELLSWTGYSGLGPDDSHILSVLELCFLMAPPCTQLRQEGNVSTKMSISVCGLLTDAVTLSADFQGEDNTLWKVTAGTGPGTIRDPVALRPWSKKELTEWAPRFSPYSLVSITDEDRPFWSTPLLILGLLGRFSFKKRLLLLGKKGVPAAVRALPTPNVTPEVVLMTGTVRTFTWLFCPQQSGWHAKFMHAHVNRKIQQSDFPPAIMTAVRSRKLPTNVSDLSSNRRCCCRDAWALNLPSKLLPKVHF